MTSKLDLARFNYFLMDYDGLIVDSEKLYFETWSEVLTPEGQVVCHTFHEGKHESEVYERVKLFLKTPMTLQEVSDFRKIRFETLVKEGKLELTEGIVELIVKIKNIAPISIVSNSTLEVVEEGLLSTGTTQYFDHLFCFGEGINRKPSPDLYNLAINTLRLNIEKTLAFEDSKTGIEAAREGKIMVACINPNPLVKPYCESLGIDYFKSAKELI